MCADSFDLTFVVPFRNEEKYIKEMLSSLQRQDLGDYSAEIFLVNGMSTDQSPLIVKKFIQQSGDPNLSFVLIDNPAQVTPAAFNLGITQTTSPIIGFGGAHTKYPSAYLRTAMELFCSVEADVVGGGHDQIISLDKDIISQAISCLYLSPMGAGVAAYHRRRTPGYVDTVYGGFYKREVFDRVGLFSESLKRNQDNEFNARVTEVGLKIYFHPGLSTVYIQKTDLGSFFKRAFNFGYYHPFTWKENPASFRLRHFIPAIWITYILILSIVSVFWVHYFIWMLIPLLLYIGLLGLSSLMLMKNKTVLVGLATIPLFALYHILYGLGIIVGFIHLLGIFKNEEWNRV